MKIISVLISFIIVNLYASEKWIKIEPITDTQIVKAQKPKSKLDINLSQIAPISKMMQNISLIQQVIKATSKKETKRESSSTKNWFIMNTQTK